jgi:hypothetical protein
MRRKEGPAARTPPARGGIDTYFDHRHRMRRPGAQTYWEHRHRMRRTSAGPAAVTPPTRQGTEAYWHYRCRMRPQDRSKDRRVLLPCPWEAKLGGAATLRAPTAQKLFAAICRGFCGEASPIEPAINIAA